MARRTLVFIFLLAFASALFAQNQNGTNPFHMSVRVAGTVPHPMGNKAFRRSLTGIYDITANCNFQVFHGITAGIQYRHNLWKTPDNKIPGLNTYAQTHHGGIRLGYDHVVNETTVAYGGITAMTGQMNFYGVSYRPDSIRGEAITEFQYKTLEIDAGVYFYTEGNFAIGIHSACVFTNFAFDPRLVYLDQHKAYLLSDFEGTFKHFNFGFQLVYSFWK
jgi:hypothetical protein